MHSWQKISYNQAKCKNPGCQWCREVVDFDGQKVTLYLHPNGAKQYHAPVCGPSKKTEMDEVYSLRDVQKEQLQLDLFKKEFVTRLHSENIVNYVLKSRRNSSSRNRLIS